MIDVNQKMQPSRSKQSTTYLLEERKATGEAGRQWALGDEAGFTSKKMGNRIIKHMDTLFETWKPREKYELILAGEVAKKKITHKLVY
jgi:hypothetical protein